MIDDSCGDITDYAAQFELRFVMMRAPDYRLSGRVSEHGRLGCPPRRCLVTAAFARPWTYCDVASVAGVRTGNVAILAIHARSRAADRVGNCCRLAFGLAANPPAMFMLSPGKTFVA
jgi:hypothetical protein